MLRSASMWRPWRKPSRSVFCGDLNVAHEEIDIARPRENRFSAGFSDQERAGFTLLLEAGFTDTFRALHPEEPGWYSWWSYRAGARAGTSDGALTTSAFPIRWLPG